MKKNLTLFLIVFFSLPCLPQTGGISGENAKYEYRFLIDMPTAGILERGYVGIINDILPEGVFISRLEVGVFDNVSFGISYGGSNIIGAGNPNWYDLPGVSLRVRIINESVLFPAISLGFDSQGKGIYFESDNRFAIKSPGFFAAVSKNFEFLGYLGVHGTANYSLENDDGDSFINLMAGVEKTVGPSISVIFDYDFTLNDNTAKLFGNGNGYLNAGIRWSLGDGFTIGFDLRDLLNNKKWSPTTADRALRIEYIQGIF